MRTNSFKCTKCGEYTRHIEISLREAASIRTENDADTNFLKALRVVYRLEAGAADLFGGRAVARDIIGYTPYKCSRCGRCAWRNSNGEEKDFIGYSK